MLFRSKVPHRVNRVRPQGDYLLDRAHVGGQRWLQQSATNGRGLDLHDASSAPVGGLEIHPDETNHLRCSAMDSDFAKRSPVTVAERPYPFPSRTRKSSSPAPKILRGQLLGKIGRRRALWRLQGFPGGVCAARVRLSSCDGSAAAHSVSVASRRVGRNRPRSSADAESVRGRPCAG